MRSALTALILSALALGAFAAPAHAQDAKTGTKAKVEYEWVLHYYMAYDNNLEKCGRPIIDMLRKGITSDKVVVVVSADFTDTDGMKRFVLTSKGETKTELKDESSAEEKTLAKELAYVRKNFAAKKYAVVFLNHGGGLGQMSVDDHPAEGDKKWLYPPKVAETLTAWRKKLPGEVELVFYQQCGKGSLENYHCMRTAGKFVMGSQTVVGAPNYYYTKVLNYVSSHPELDGEELAKQITKHDPPNMFTTYSTFSSKHLEDLPKKIDAVIEPLLALKAIKIPRGMKPCFNFGRREIFFDGVAMFRAFYKANGLDAKKVEDFATWVKEDLITSHRVSPLKDRMAKAKDWCGFSLFFPPNPRMLAHYKDYPFYKATKVDDLYRELFRQLIEARKAKKPASE